MEDFCFIVEIRRGTKMNKKFMTTKDAAEAKIHIILEGLRVIKGIPQHCSKRQLHCYVAEY